MNLQRQIQRTTLKKARKASRAVASVRLQIEHGADAEALAESRGAALARLLSGLPGAHVARLVTSMRFNLEDEMAGEAYTLAVRRRFMAPALLVLAIFAATLVVALASAHVS